jgi:hypothetical protein
MNESLFCWFTLGLLGATAVIWTVDAILERRREQARRRAERASLARLFHDPSRHCRFRP